MTGDLSDAIIRPARHVDLPAIHHIITACYAPYIDVMGQKPGPMLDDYTAHIDAGHLWVATQSDQVVALIVLIPQSATMLLDNIAVAPAAQGRGLFRHLMQFGEDQAQQQGFDTITLYTHAKMTRNLTLYPKLGYVQTHRETQNGFDRVFFRKDLESVGGSTQTS